MDQIQKLLSHGVANIIPDKKQLETLLRSDKKLNVYFGIDPTATRIHIGHAFPLRKLQTFVELGHHVTFLIGDFTALIGDTSDKDTERPILTYDQIEENFQTYKRQASKILDFSKITIVHNSDWLKKLNFEDIIKLARHFSLNDFISRELIKKRLSNNNSISLPEVLYPLMQGYDSWYLDTDLQLGGTDQTFNMQAGRTLQKKLRDKESFVMANEFLEGTDGRKMSKSWGNAIWLEDTPDEMFGKTMSLRDELIGRYFELATNLTEIQISNLKLQFTNPMDLKKQLAWQIVSELYSPSVADLARKSFESIFQQGSTPQELPTISTQSTNILDILVDSNLASSKSEARRLIDQGGVSVNNEKITTYTYTLSPNPTVVRVGRRFVKIEPLVNT